MKQIFRDILFLALIPLTFLILLFEMKLQLSPFQHKLLQIFIMFIIYILVALWIHFDLKAKERKMNEKLSYQLKIKKVFKQEKKFGHFSKDKKKQKTGMINH